MNITKLSINFAYADTQIVDCHIYIFKTIKMSFFFMHINFILTYYRYFYIFMHIKVGWKYSKQRLQNHPFVTKVVHAC